VQQMAVLLQRHGFAVREDADIAELGARSGPTVAHQVRFMHHLRFANAQKT